jgi:hypothetical protein
MIDAAAPATDAEVARLRHRIIVLEAEVALLRSATIDRRESERRTAHQPAIDAGGAR